MTERVIFYDIELTADCFLLGALENGVYDHAVIRDRADDDIIRTLREHFAGVRLVGFNNLGFDSYLLEGLLRGWTTAELHRLAHEIITGKEHTWEVAQRWNLRHAPFDEIDLMHFIPRRANLKVLEARLKMRHVRDIPFDPYAAIDETNLATVLAYNEHDCRATKALYDKLGEEIATRQALADIFDNQGLMRKLPASAAEAAIMGEYEARTGETKPEIRARAAKMLDCSFLIQPAAWLREVVKGSPEAERMLSAVDGMRIEMIDGKRQVPTPALPEGADLGGLPVTFGLGGLHSIDGAGRADSDAGHVLWNVDVASYYPALMMKPAGAPVHLDGAVYRTIFGGILSRRLEAKRLGRKREADANKLVVNSLFGKQNERHSRLYSPPSFLSITLNGQLCLTALIERIQMGSDALVISANTDGVLIQLPRDSEAVVEAILRGWEEATGFSLEKTEIAHYRRLNVNTYITVGRYGKVSAKGLLGFGGGLDTDHKELIVAEAVAVAMQGGDPATVVRAAAARKDLSVFVDMLTTRGSGFVCGGVRHGRVIRIYRTTDSTPPDIIDGAKGRVGDRHRGRGCRVVEDLEAWPADIDVDAYVAAAKAILGETAVPINRRRTALARSLERAGLKTVGEGGATKVRSGGDFAGSAAIQIIVADKDDFVVVAPSVLEEESLIVAVEGGERAEVHRKSLLPADTAKTLRAAELSRRKAAGIGNTARRLTVWSEAGVRFRLGAAGKSAELTTPLSEDEGKMAEDVKAAAGAGADDAAASVSDMDNKVFVEAMFGELAKEAFVVSRSGDPETWEGWGGGPVWASNDAYRKPWTNNYVAISLFGRSEDDGRYHRTMECWRGLAAIMVDDIGTKAANPQTRGWGPPSAVVETSAGNTQHLYFLDSVERDGMRAQMLVGMVTGGGDRAFGDPGAGDLNRVARLPDAINGKKKYEVDGKAFHCRLLEWAPERRYSPDTIASWCGKSLPEEGAYDAFDQERGAVASLEEAMRHPVVLALKKEGLWVDTRLNLRKWLPVGCLWENEHTGGKKGTAICILENGAWSYNCMHGHCAERKTRAAWQKLAELGYEIPPPGAGRGSSFEAVEIGKEEFTPGGSESGGGKDGGEGKERPKEDGGGKLSVGEFVFLSPVNKLIYRPSGEIWARPGVDSRLGKVKVGTGKAVKEISPSAWIARHSPVEGMTWDPAAGEIIADKLYLERGIVPRRGVRVYNLFKGPPLLVGDVGRAAAWVDHLRKVYPEDWQHIADYLAHLFQKVGVKINHCLVLGGKQGIGKDSILVPVVAGLGAWNCAEIAPDVLFKDFNEYVRSLFIRISEARDASEVDRCQFYERTKTLFAAPPEMLRVNTKFVPAHHVPNVAGTAITTNSKETGLFLPPDDRRHFVAWSELDQDDFEEGYFPELHNWYDAGGIGHVAAWLKARDVSRFDPKAPPPRTPAFWSIVNANRAEEDNRAPALEEWLIDGGKLPAALSIDWLLDLIDRSPITATLELLKTLNEIKGPRRRKAPDFFHAAGYVPVHNPGQKKEGRWKIRRRNVIVYARIELSPAERLEAARTFCDCENASERIDDVARPEGEKDRLN